MSALSGMNRFRDRLTCRPGATDAMIGESQRQCGKTFPEEYVQFIKLTNGAEGFIGKNAYLILWGVEDLAFLNKAYEVQSYVPGLLIFGSDGGGEAYGFDTRSKEWTIVQVPFVGMDWSFARPVSSSFDRFLERLHETP